MRYNILEILMHLHKVKVGPSELTGLQIFEDDDIESNDNCQVSAEWMGRHCGKKC